MSEPRDSKLYEQAKQWADEHYKTHSAYKSMAIQRKYNELYSEIHNIGNPYIGKAKRDLQKWRNEQWIDVEDYLKGRITKCGSKPYDASKNYVACRPLSELQKMDYNVIREHLKQKKKSKHNSIDWTDAWPLRIPQTF